MDVHLGYEIISHGLYPDLVGQMKLNVKSMQQNKIKSIQLLNRGKLLSIDIH